MSLGTLLLQGYYFGSARNKHAIVHGSSAVINVHIKLDVLVVDSGIEKEKLHGLIEVILKAIDESEPPDITLQLSALVLFHRRFEHLNYDDVACFSAKRAKGIELTDHVREKCIACTEGK
uniref:GAG-pre-integrase domain-containing protein n=1 Tax=Peronospora matthiolae TaxID=2874970 RepID=A0AAV1TJM1_9STRA